MSLHSAWLHVQIGQKRAAKEEIERHDTAYLYEYKRDLLRFVEQITDVLEERNGYDEEPDVDDDFPMELEYNDIPGVNAPPEMSSIEDWHLEQAYEDRVSGSYDE